MQLNSKLLFRDRSMSLPYIARGLKISRSKSPAGDVAEPESGSENR